MNAQEYVPLARRTMKELGEFRHHMIHMALGVTGEIGELIDLAKKVFVYAKPYDHVNATEECGDGLWYIAGMLPELGVPADYFGRALIFGYNKGLGLQQKTDVWEDFTLGAILLSINAQISSAASTLCELNPSEVVGRYPVYQLVEMFAGNYGVIMGILGVDPALAMQRNIEKLAKRYGDKYSDVAALNRDLGAERATLEGKPVEVSPVSIVPPAPPLNLDDDKPLEGGGACATEGPCEGCQ